MNKGELLLWLLLNGSVVFIIVLCVFVGIMGCNCKVGFG